MKNILVLLVLLLMIKPSKTDLTITIENLPTDDGVVRVLLFDSPAGFPEDESKAAKSAVVQIIDGKATLRLQDLEHGNYAISAFHDANEDGALNKNSLGIPKEVYGFSNNARGSFGPPTFNSASFEIDGDNQTHRMKLK